jgi:hypothetical protein
MEARYTYRLRVSPAQGERFKRSSTPAGSCGTPRLAAGPTCGAMSSVSSLGYVSMAAELTDWRGPVRVAGSGARDPPTAGISGTSTKPIRAFYDKKHPGRRPRFKKKGSHSTASWNANGFALRGAGSRGAVKGGPHPLRVVWSRDLPTAPKSVTVYRDAAGRWWASFVVRVETEDLGVTGASTGLDVGLDHLRHYGVPGRRHL